MTTRGKKDVASEPGVMPDLLVFPFARARAQALRLANGDEPTGAEAVGKKKGRSAPGLCWRLTYLATYHREAR